MCLVPKDRPKASHALALQVEQVALRSKHPLVRATEAAAVEVAVIDRHLDIHHCSQEALVEFLVEDKPVVAAAVHDYSSLPRHNFLARRKNSLRDEQ